MSQPQGRSRVTALSPQGKRLLTRTAGTSLPAASRDRTAQKLAGGSGSGDLSRLKHQLRMTTLSSADSGDEMDQLMSESRQRFQEMLADTDMLGSRFPAGSDLFKGREISPGLGMLSGGNSVGSDRLAFGKAPPTLFKDPASSSLPLNAPTTSLFKDTPLRSQPLGGGASPLSKRTPLSQRLNMNMFDESGLENMLPSMKDGPSSLTLPMNGAVHLLPRMGSPQMSRPLAQSGMVSPMSSGALSLPGLQHTIKTSSTSSTTKLTSLGGPNGDVTHVERQEQREHSTSNGTSRVQQTRAQKMETATISRKNGKTEVDARRAELAQQRTARQRADGSAEVSEQVRASGGTRRALLERTNSGSQRVQLVTGEDCEAEVRTALHITPAGDVTQTGGQVVPYGGDRQVSGPLWRFFEAGPLIQPPGMKVRGKMQVQASRTVLNYKQGQLPSIKNDRFAYEDSFGGSESESDDDFDSPALEGGRCALPASQTRQRQLPWKTRPALTAPSNSQLSTSPADSNRAKLALPWRQKTDKASSAPAAAASGVSRALPWRPSVRPVSLAPSEASSEGADLEHPDDVIADVTEEAAAARKKRLCKIATELLTSERRYVQELQLIDQVFRVRVEDANRQHAMFESDVPSHMFANIQSIHQFHRDHLLPRLEQRLKEWDSTPRIGDIMKGSAPFLKMYTEFVSGFSTSSSLICAHYSKTPRFAAVMDQIHEMPECANLTLEHHMITPVQRIPRYELLLRDYLKSLPDDSPDRSDTERALELVTLAARHSNDTMKRNEKFKQLLEIQENISGGPDLVSPHRELVKEGKIMKISARSGDHQERYLFLFSDLLLLCSPRLINKRIISGPAYRLRAKFAIEGLQVLEGDNLETLNTFYICGNQKNVELYTQSSEERCAWLEALCDVVRRFYERKASLRGAADPATTELGRSAPQMAPLEAAVRCCRCDAAFSVIRRKHNCRACGEVVCGRCSGQKAPLPCEQGREVRVCDLCYQRLSSRRETPRPLRQTVLDATYTRGGGVLAMPGSEPGTLSGELQLRSKRVWVSRFFVLRANFVLYMYESAKSREALAATPVPGFTVSWAGSGKTESGLQERDRDRAFKLSLANRNYIFLAESRDSAARWIGVLQKASRAEVPMPGQLKP